MQIRMLSLEKEAETEGESIKRSEKEREGENARERGQAGSTRRERYLSEEREATSAIEALLSRCQAE